MMYLYLVARHRVPPALSWVLAEQRSNMAASIPGARLPWGSTQRPAQSHKWVRRRETGWTRIVDPPPRHLQPLRATAEAQTPQTESVNWDLTFPHKDTFTIDGQELHASQVLEMLEPFMTPERIARIDKLVEWRQFGVFPLLENTYDMGNLAAVCRTADAMGFGAVHYILRSDEKYKQSSRSAAGADKWLDVRLWESTASAVKAVKAAGFQLVVTHLSKSSVTLQEIDFTRPTALVLGNERHGASEEIVAAADHCAIIPMTGMVESLNISVAAAICLYEAQQQRARKGLKGDLSSEQRQILKAALSIRSLRDSETLMGQLLKRPPPQWQEGRVKKWRKREARQAEELDPSEHS